MLYYDFDKMCRGEIFDESGSGNNGMSRGRVIVEAGYNQDNGVDLSDGFIQLDGMNFKVWWGMLRAFSTNLSRCGGLWVTALVSGSSGPGSGPDQGHCAVFLGKKLYSHSASLHPGVQVGTGEFNAWGNPGVD